jgi:hypothetical protein
VLLAPRARGRPADSRLAANRGDRHPFIFQLRVIQESERANLFIAANEEACGSDAARTNAHLSILQLCSEIC